MLKRLFMLMFILAIAMIPLVSVFSMDGLVGVWLFDEGSGNSAKDSSGKGHDGELVGKATYDKNGKYGSAITCDGTEAYVKVPDHADFVFKGDFTLCCWFLNDGVPPADNSGIITKGYHTTSANGGDAKPWYLVYFMKGGPVDMFLRDTNAINSRAVGKTPVNDGKWHHVIGSREGNKVKIYIDGVEDGSADAVDANYGGNSLPLVFMVHFDRWIKGLIDEVAIFNKALSAKEIGTVMNGLKGVMAVEAGGKLASKWGQLKN